MATTAEQLILRGLHLIIRTTFSPNDEVGRAKHFVALQSDIGPWLKDYAAEIEKPATDWNVEFLKATGEEPGGGAQQ
jgi:hypothetical protein